MKVKLKFISALCGLVLFALAAMTPHKVLAQTNYYWRTIANPVSNTGGAPQGMVVDNAGNLYIADPSDNTILKATPASTNWIVSTNWVVTTIAGLAGVSGTNDGIGSAARFNAPNSLALGDPDTLIVADSANSTIRKVSYNGTNWVVTTIAGSVATAGTATDGTNGDAGFNYPSGVAADTLNTPKIVYVSDTYNSIIRKITSTDGSTWVTTTIAGSAATAGTATDGINGNAGFNFPYDVAMNKDGNLFVADYENSIIRELVSSGTNWIVTTIAGSAATAGSGTDGANGGAGFNGPTAVKTDNAGNVFVADTFNDTVRKLTPSGTNWIVTTIGGSAGGGGFSDGTNDMAAFSSPQGVAADNAGNIYVSDTGNNAIRLGLIFPPLLQMTLAANQATLFYPALLGTNVGFNVQSATNLVNNSWTFLTNNWKLATGGMPYVSLTVTNQVPDNFFRLQMP